MTMGIAAFRRFSGFVFTSRGGTNTGAGWISGGFFDSNRRSGSGAFHHRQQLPCTADGHEPGEVVVVFGELVVGWHADEDDGFGVEAFGFVDGGVRDKC